jgi:DNA repair protein RadC
MKTKTNFINELSINYNKKLFSTNRINCSHDVEQIIREIYTQTSSGIELKEYFFIMFLNRANEVIGYNKLSEGGICGTVVDIRLAFASALKSLAISMILVHNHPSGNLNPSEQDIDITKKFVKAGALLEINIFDHIILTNDSYYSFADEGLI